VEERGDKISSRRCPGGYLRSTGIAKEGPQALDTVARETRGGKRRGKGSKEQLRPPPSFDHVLHEQGPSLQETKGLRARERQASGERLGAY